MTKLERLPEQVDRVESQIVQLRTEIRDEFSAVRAELRGEIRVTADAIKQELREEIRGGDEETRRLMRVLHEEVISRFALLEEGRPPRGSRKRRGDGV